MARKKIVEPEVDETEVATEEANSIINETQEANASDDAPEAKNATEPSSAEPSAQVTAILKSFARYKELWITPFGGVYTRKPDNSGSAILYKNPYYKNS